MNVSQLSASIIAWARLGEDTTAIMRKAEMLLGKEPVVEGLASAIDRQATKQLTEACALPYPLLVARRTDPVS
jgi:urease gamma subunit